LKKIYRYPKNETGFIIKKNKKFINKDKFDFKKIYRLHDYIKLTNQDFNQLSQINSTFVHFNLEWTGHKKNKNYLIVKIIKKGSFDGKIYRAPIISSKKVLFAKCLSFKNKIKYKNLTKKDFIYSLKTIKNNKDLKKAIIRRYKKSLPHMSKNSIINLGVAITKLKILNESNLSKYLK
jgi:hypothetical protein